MTHPQLPAILSKLTSLEDALLSADPKMPHHLREIHKYLISFEELAHLLTEDQIAIIVQGQQKLVGIVLAEETKKGKGSGSRKAVSAEEL